MTPVAVPAPAAHAARRLGAAIARTAVWFWTGAVAVVLVGNVIGWAVTGSTDVSIAVHLRDIATWFPFSLAIMVVTACLRVHVASGMTRRTFVRAALLVEVGAGIVYGVAHTALVLLERAAHTALGWGSSITEILVVDTASPAWALLVELTLPYVLGNLAGLLVGVVYQRGGAWWGTLTLPLTAGPVVAWLYVGPRWLTDLTRLWTDPTDARLVGVAAGTALVLAAVSAGVFVVLARRTPLNATS